MIPLGEALRMSEGAGSLNISCAGDDGLALVGQQLGDDFAYLLDVVPPLTPGSQVA